ncbi:MAG: hypothetical protein ABJG88_05515 [Litorimonas sp.]
MKALPLSVLLTGLLSSTSLAQDYNPNIQTETLGAARAFDAGALGAFDRGLDLGVGLWQGTSAALATSLIEAAPIKSEDLILRDMIRAALLSAGEPPQGARDDFEAVRLRAVMALGDDTALEVLTAHNPVLAQSPTFRADRALVQNDGTAACNVSDQITKNRAEPVWARLRILCHVLRDEVAAAELTRDLLQNSGYEEANYFALLSMMLRGKSLTELPPARPSDDALVDFMRVKLSPARIDRAVISDTAQSPKARLEALWANLEGTDINDLTGLMSDIAFDVNDVVASSSFDLESATAENTPQSTGQLFLLARSGNLDALTAFIARAPKDKQDELQGVMFDNLTSLPAADMIALDLYGFTEKAIAARDIGALQALHQGLSDDKRQSRLALATDSVGNGFNFGPLGRDIDDRLGDKKTATRARRDAMIALAMGAQISDAARSALQGYNFTDGRKISDGDMVLLQQAAKTGAQAELVLRSAALLEGETLNASSLSTLIGLLNSAGLSQFAGQIAAQDFISELN